MDAQFDRRVWERIRAAERLLGTTAPTPMPFGMPWWLVVLNVIAVIAAVVTVGFALGVAGPISVARSINAAFALAEHTQGSARPLALVAICTVLWLCSRQTPLARAIARAYL